MSNLDDNIVGRLSALEFIAAQCLSVSLLNVPDKKSFIAQSRELFCSRVNRLPPEAASHALETVDRVYSSALRSAKEISGQG